eukprot:CAMPEP_0118946974 /NCGR_PEP_ID=MMETSP1169-20130426/45178_1 /TAXON_ID=36882 /ORGANISM="Pyramimonas obovata, Strain CCMP722" /LENGTH=141 /DNA_ID=CAMNT_0006893093 /DNA_START=108 /DNA_END=529 /DNA_ORIENTATION=+
MVSFDTTHHTNTAARGAACVSPQRRSHDDRRTTPAWARLSAQPDRVRAAPEHALLSLHEANQAANRITTAPVPSAVVADGTQTHNVKRPHRRSDGPDARPQRNALGSAPEVFGHRPCACSHVHRRMVRPAAARRASVLVAP